MVHSEVGGFGSPGVDKTINKPVYGDASQVLSRFMDEPDEGRATALVERLVREYADPVIKSVVRRKMEVYLDYVWRLDSRARGDEPDGSRPSRPIPKRSRELDAEDVYSSSVIDLIGHLWSVKSSPERLPMSDFSGYVARIAFNAFALHMRRQCPQRHRLRRKLWFLAQGHLPASGFTIWPGSTSGGQVFGFEAWRGRIPHQSGNCRQWKDDPKSFERSEFRQSDISRCALPDLISRILNWADSPMELDDLTNGLVELLGLKEPEEYDA